MDYEPCGSSSCIAILPRLRHRNHFHPLFDEYHVLNPQEVPHSRVDYPVLLDSVDPPSTPRKPRSSVLPLVAPVSVVADQPDLC